MATQVPQYARLMFRRHVKALGIALPLSAVTIVEIRDMYERSQWDAPSGLNDYATGDVILISNRWYSLPTWREAFYSLTLKLLMKTAWDDAGIIINTSGEPNLLHCGYHDVKLMPLSAFLNGRQPRGCAVRRIKSLQNVTHKVTSSDVDAYARSCLDRRPTPWAILWACWEDSQKANQYRYAVQASELAWEIRKMMGDGSSHEAIEAKKSKLHDNIVMEMEYGRHVPDDGPRPLRKLFSTSLVAEVLQEMKLLPEPKPSATSYAPADLVWKLPLINATMLDPVVVYSS